MIVAVNKAVYGRKAYFMSGQMNAYNIDILFALCTNFPKQGSHCKQIVNSTGPSFQVQICSCQYKTFDEDSNLLKHWYWLYIPYWIQGQWINYSANVGIISVPRRRLKWDGASAPETMFTGTVSLRFQYGGCMHQANGLSVGEKTIISYEMGKASWIRLGMSLSCL